MGKYTLTVVKDLGLFHGRVAGEQETTTHSNSCRAPGSCVLSTYSKVSMWSNWLTPNHPMQWALVRTLLLQDPAAGKQKSRDSDSASPACNH